MKFEVDIPWWAEEEQDQDLILFLAYLYKLGKVYGQKNTFRLYNTDVRTILGIMHDRVDTYLAKQPWSKYLLTSDMQDNAIGYKNVKPVNRLRTENIACVRKELTDTRCVLVWVYILGCFNNNLVEDADHVPTKGLTQDWKDIFKSYAKLL